VQQNKNYYSSKKWHQGQEDEAVYGLFVFTVASGAVIVHQTWKAPSSAELCE